MGAQLFIIDYSRDHGLSSRFAACLYRMIAMVVMGTGGLLQLAGWRKNRATRIVPGCLRKRQDQSFSWSLGSVQPVSGLGVAPPREDKLLTEPV